MSKSDKNPTTVLWEIQPCICIHDRLVKISEMLVTESVYVLSKYKYNIWETEIRIERIHILLGTWFL